MEDINLPFTGDIYAVTTANNLLCAMIDNHIYHGNELRIDVKNITFKRCMDMNDRALRNIVCGLGVRTDGIPREDGFDISAASEIMAVLCLASDPADLRRRLDRITIGSVSYTHLDVYKRQAPLFHRGSHTRLRHPLQAPQPRHPAWITDWTHKPRPWRRMPVSPGSGTPF